MPFMTRPRRCGNGVVKIGESLALQRSHDSFEGPDHVVVFWCDERERVPGALGAACAPNAMDIRVGGIRHVVVDNVGDTVDIEPARGDVGGDHDAEVTGLETAQGLFTLPLRSVAVQARDAKPRVCDLPRHFVRAVFCAREDQNRVSIDLLE